MLQNEKDNAKLRVQGLIVVDLEYRGMSDDAFYMVTGENGALKLAPGHKGLENIAGKVLCVCMPPRRESTASESFEL